MVLVIGRGRWIVDSVVSEIRVHGFDGVGTTTDAEALSQLDTGKIDLLVIGGGVEVDSRSTLKQKAGAHGTDVLERPLGRRDVESYVKQEIVQRLRTDRGRVRSGIDHLRRVARPRGRRRVTVPRVITKRAKRVIHA